MHTMTTTCRSHEMRSVDIAVYGLLGAGIITGLLTEKLVVHDFTEFKLASLWAYFEEMRAAVDKFTKNPDDTSNNMRELITIASVAVFLLFHFVYGVYSTNRLFASFVATVFISVPVIFFVYLLHVALSPRTMATTIMPVNVPPPP